MPRTSGVATTSRLLLILFSPRPIRVACWPGFCPLPDFTWVMRIFFSDIARLHRGILLRAEQIRHLLAAARGHEARAGHAGECRERRLHHVVRVTATERLRHHVADAQRLEHRAQRAAGDDAGAGGRGADHHMASAELTRDVVVQRAAFLHRNADHGLFRAFSRLADRFGNFARLAGAVTDAAFLVAHDDECGKCEPTAAFHHFRHAVDGHQLVDETVISLPIALALALTTPAATAAFTCFACHKLCS